jgi:hypothetical protein
VKLDLSEKRKRSQRVFGSTLLRKVLGPKKKEVTQAEGNGMLVNEDFLDS